MTASAVFILDMKGKVIISRNYRGDVPMNCVERFSGHVLEAEEAELKTQASESSDRIPDNRIEFLQSWLVGVRADHSRTEDKTAESSA